MLCYPNHYILFVRAATSTPKKLPKLKYCFFPCGIDPYLHGKL
jgi:hypothetical protein